MPGPAPKNPKLRQRRNKRPSAEVFQEVKVVDKMPELPERRRKWKPETIAWWKSVWDSPMAREGKFIDVDLHRLYILADLVDEFWRVPAKLFSKKIALANEIRLQGQCFGLTPIDRNRLDWQFEKTDDLKNKGDKRRATRYQLKKHQVDPRATIAAVN